MKEVIDSKCRLYKRHEENIDHLISGCPILVKNEYLMRHDRDGAHLHCPVCKAQAITTTEKNGTKLSKSLREHEDTKILWNQKVNTDREVTETRPDVIGGLEL